MSIYGAMVTEIFVFGYDKKKKTVRCRNNPAVLLPDGVYRVEIHHEDGCVSHAYIKPSELGVIDNISKYTSAPEKIYGRYPTATLNNNPAEYAEKLKAIFPDIVKGIKEVK